MDQAVKPVDCDAFDPQLWIRAVNSLRKTDWGVVMNASDAGASLKVL